MQNQTRQQRRAAQRAITKNSPWSGILSAAQAAAARKAGVEPTAATTSGAPYAPRPRRFASAVALASLAAGRLVT